MVNFDFIEKRLKRFNTYLDKLYFTGNLKLSELYSFRDILKDIDSMFKKLKSFSVFGIVPLFVKKDINRLNSELILMEYNISLISVNASCGM